MRNRLWRRVNVFLYLNEEDGWREPVRGGPAAEVRRGGKTFLTLSVPPHLFCVTSTAARAIVFLRQTCEGLGDAQCVPATTHNASTARPFTGGDLELWPEGLFPPR